MASTEGCNLFDSVDWLADPSVYLIGCRVYLSSMTCGDCGLFFHRCARTIGLRILGLLCPLGLQ